jgi:hypothetical protein
MPRLSKEKQATLHAVARMGQGVESRAGLGVGI